MPLRSNPLAIQAHRGWNLDCLINAGELLSPTLKVLASIAIVLDVGKRQLGMAGLKGGLVTGLDIHVVVQISHPWRHLPV